MRFFDDGNGCVALPQGGLRRSMIRERGREKERKRG